MTNNLSRRMVICLAVGTVMTPSLLMAGGVAPKAEMHTVEITGFKFVPDVLDVRAGDRIRWINRDIAPHTATAIDDSWDTGSLEKDASIVTVVRANMSEDYFCRFHPHMTAKLKLKTE